MFYQSGGHKDPLESEYAAPQGGSFIVAIVVLKCSAHIAMLQAPVVLEPLRMGGKVTNHSRDSIKNCTVEKDKNY